MIGSRNAPGRLAPLLASITPADGHAAPAGDRFAQHSPSHDAHDCGRGEAIVFGDAAHGLPSLDGLDNGPVTLMSRRAPHPPGIETPAPLRLGGMVHGATAGPSPSRNRASELTDLFCREWDWEALVELARYPAHPLHPGVQVCAPVLRIGPMADVTEQSVVAPAREQPAGDVGVGRFVPIVVEVARGPAK